MAGSNGRDLPHAHAHATGGPGPPRQAPHDSLTYASRVPTVLWTPLLTDGSSVPNTSPQNESQPFHAPIVCEDDRAPGYVGYTLPISSSGLRHSRTDSIQQWLQSITESAQQHDQIGPGQTYQQRQNPSLSQVPCYTVRGAPNQLPITYCTPDRFGQYPIASNHTSHQVDVPSRHANSYPYPASSYGPHFDIYNTRGEQQMRHAPHAPSPANPSYHPQQSRQAQMSRIHDPNAPGYAPATPSPASPYDHSMAHHFHPHVQQQMPTYISQPLRQPLYYPQPQSNQGVPRSYTYPFPSQGLPDPTIVNNPHSAFTSHTEGYYQTQDFGHDHTQQSKRKFDPDEASRVSDSHEKTKRVYKQRILRPPIAKDKPAKPSRSVRMPPQRHLSAPNPHTPTVREPQQLDPGYWDTQPQFIVSKHDDYKWSVHLYKINPEVTGYQSALAWINDVLKHKEREGVRFKWFEHTTIGYFRVEPSPLSFIVLHQAVNPYGLFGRDETTTSIGFYVASETDYSEIYWKTISPGLSMVLWNMQEARCILPAFSWHINMQATDRRWHVAYWKAANMFENLGGLMGHAATVKKAAESIKEDEEVIEIDESYLDNTGGYDVSEEEADVIWQECLLAAYNYGETGQQAHIPDAAVIDCSEWQD